MKKTISYTLISLVLLLLLIVFFFKSCVIYNPKPEACDVVITKIQNIRAGSTFDIQFLDTKGKVYYINRGLEQGLNLETLNAIVLNKTVTLHLPKLTFGASTHIAQLAIEDQIIFTEFKN